MRRAFTSFAHSWVQRLMALSLAKKYLKQYARRLKHDLKGKDIKRLYLVLHHHWVSFAYVLHCFPPEQNHGTNELLQRTRFHLALRST